jgi:hypothetical protein
MRVAAWALAALIVAPFARAADNGLADCPFSDLRFHPGAFGARGGGEPDSFF